MIGDAVAWLRDRLPSQWEVERVGPDGNTPPDDQLSDDAVLYIRSPNRTIGTLAVQARPSLEPREAAQLLPSLARTLRSLAGSTPVLVIAPWLSERTRQLLQEQEINYIDLTGNALLSLSSPGLFISSDGATRNPAPKPRGRALVRGPRAARLIRLLADVHPPYGVSELARAADLTPGYVSRLLDTLDSEALVARSRRGVVDQVDFVGLLRRWSESYDVLQTNRAFAFLAPKGATDALQRLAAEASDSRYLITGSFAAVRMAPVAAPALLLVYSDDPMSLARKLGLLPADEGANVVLLAPFDSVVWERSSRNDGLHYACPSQVAADCLSGTGRMPVEAEALLDWLLANERTWRWKSLDQLPIREQ
ncbi:MAG TPA: helix-turn-helix domain-containing protein [Solirubrobacteraceae bacterium]|nr:helix-turn-helix domain-containing protein [Solirubrobacteraceae bacterium]